MMNSFALLSLIASFLPITSRQTKPPHKSLPPLVIGWHDEMNAPALWKPLNMENQPDIYASRWGLLTLRLPHVPKGFPYTYQWSGVTRSMSADLTHYPVLMARVSQMDVGSYAHLDIEERDIVGHPVKTWRSPTLTKPGLTTIDLGKEIGGDVHRLTVRLIVGGKLTGAKCEYNWVRFVHREEVAYFEEAPDTQSVISREPSGDKEYGTILKN